MISAETWEEQVEFEGHASAVVIVTGIQVCPGERYEVRLDCLALGTYSTPFPIAVYIWDDRETKWCREYYTSTFEIGSCWRISGKIDYDKVVAFCDPVYMPFIGKEFDILRNADKNNEPSAE